jgi:hypothetical protein
MISMSGRRVFLPLTFLGPRKMGAHYNIVFLLISSRNIAVVILQKLLSCLAIIRFSGNTYTKVIALKEQCTFFFPHTWNYLSIYILLFHRWLRLRLRHYQVDILEAVPTHLVPRFLRIFGHRVSGIPSLAAHAVHTVHTARGDARMVNQQTQDD